jgi:23S rRNA (uridine2552-2'-O)-methyltransferase
VVLAGPGSVVHEGHYHPLVAKRVLHDKYFKLAKAEGYLARSAYKLKEIDQRFKLIRKGSRILDMGCAPGSWLQVAAERVGESGRVVGIDLKRVDHRMPAQVVTMEGDIEATPPGVLTEMGGGLFDLVLSDMAPNTSGHADDLVSSRLCRSVLALLPGLLAPGRGFAMKILEGQEYPLVLRETKQLFRDARGFKPKSCRDASREMYIVGKGYKGPTTRREMPTADADSGVDGGARSGEREATG